MSARTNLGAALLCLVMAGCASTGDTHAPPTASISGTIEYGGTAAGGGRPLAIAVYRRFPPKGPPVAWRLVERPQFPYRYTFDNLPPGDYVVGALIDVDPSDTRNIGQLNPKRDPHAYSKGGGLTHVDEQHGAVGLDLVLEGGE